MSSGAALLIVDVQKVCFSIPEAPLYDGDKLILRIKRLIEKARASNIPIIYVQHCGSKGDVPGSVFCELRSAEDVEF